ncbi:MAG: PTS sugar transporter subunit IIA, partial [Pseudomonadota bacterium]
PNVQKPQIIFVRLKQPLSVESPDNLPLDLFCIVVSSKDDIGTGLQTVSSLSRLMSDPFLCDQLKCLKSADHIHEVMAQRQSMRYAA